MCAPLLWQRGRTDRAVRSCCCLPAPLTSPSSSLSSTLSTAAYSYILFVTVFLKMHTNTQTQRHWTQWTETTSERWLFSVRARTRERERVLCLSYEWNVRKKSGVCSPRIARIHVAMQATQCFLMSLRMLFIVDSSVFFCFCLICVCVVCCCSAFGSWVSVHCQRDPALALEQTNHLFYAHSFITLFG